MLDDLQVAAKEVDLVLVTNEQLQQWISFLEDTASCPDDPERLIQSWCVLDGRQELGGLFCSRLGRHS